MAFPLERTFSHPLGKLSFWRSTASVKMKATTVWLLGTMMAALRRKGLLIKQPASTAQSEAFVIKLLSHTFLSVAGAPQLSTKATSLERINFETSWPYPFYIQIKSLIQVPNLLNTFPTWGNARASSPVAIPKSSHILRCFF